MIITATTRPNAVHCFQFQFFILFYFFNKRYFSFLCCFQTRVNRFSSLNEQRLTGIPEPGLTTNDEYLTFNTFGYYNVTVEALVNIDGLDPYTSTISVIIRTLPSSMARETLSRGN